ncbi:MAG: ABC transporter permease subunit [Planctomycetes bacterium]|nr:ABC transporter permease subunit [Planctomycetota bacterium]MCP4838789.1 ABC transporter permease subunit [Planctomycetota bacterium]
MRRILAVAWCELRVFFLSPSGWIVPALFLFASGLVFMQTAFRAGHPATLRGVFVFDAVFLLIAGPAIVMGSFCESRRRGTLALLQASPASAWDIVLGKWLGGMGVLAVVLVPTWSQVLLLESYGRPDLGALAGGYLGLFLLGGAVLATGLLVSALVMSQAVAFLVTGLAWILAAVLLEVALPKMLGPSWRGMLSSLDPLQRQQDFTLGLLDSANIAYFVSLAVIVLMAAAVVTRVGARRTPTIFGLVGLLVLLVGFNVSASSPQLRSYLDATKSRVYSLSPRTLSMLTDIDGQWQVSVMLHEDRADPALLRQIDEVLQQFSQAAPELAVQRLDPADQRDILAWERVLADLRALDSSKAAEWRAAIRGGIDTFESLIVFAQTVAGPMRSVSAGGDDISAAVSALAIIASQGHRILDTVEQSMETGPAQPLPDWIGAKAILQQALMQWGMELGGMDHALRSREGVMPAVCSAESFAARAEELARAADRLGQLSPLPSAALGRQLLEGEAAVVMGPGGGRVIAASQLIPGAFSEAGGGRVAFDQRFRGEQIIASAIRSIADEVTPRVVFVHDGTVSALQPSNPDIDVSGAVSMLRAGGMQVEEWQPHQSPVRPDWAAGPTAWVILPPARRGAVEMSSDEAALLRATADLIAAGEGVMLNLFPSQASSLGQPDPWSGLARDLGVDARTSEVLLRDISTSDGRQPPRASIELAEFPAAHAVAAAVHGQPLTLPLPIHVSLLADTKDLVILAEAEPDPALWMEPRWRSLVSADPRLRRRPPTFDPARVPQEPIPVAVGGTSPYGGRILVIGSGNWMRTGVADAATNAGGDRIALVHPGNHELMVSGTSWLAGLDDRIARGALSQEVARLRSISSADRRFWGWMILGVLPGGALSLALVTWVRRRN